MSGHASYVNVVAISSDSEFIVSGSSDKTVRLWDVKTGTSKTMSGHTSSFYAVAISTDQQYIISGSLDKTIRLWSTKTQECIKVLKGHSGYVFSVIFSVDDNYIISGSYDKTIRVWNVQSGEQICEMNNFDYAGSLSLSRDGVWLVSSTGDKIYGSETIYYRVRRWNVERLLNVSGEQQQNQLKVSLDLNINLLDWTRVYGDYGLGFKNCTMSNSKMSVQDRERYIK